MIKKDYTLHNISALEKAQCELCKNKATKLVSFAGGEKSLSCDKHVKTLCEYFTRSKIG